MASRSHGEAWEANLQELKTYKRQNGHCRVPFKFETDNGKKLGAWVRAQRTFYKQGNLSQNRIDALNAISFSWRVRRVKASWGEMFEALKEFKAEHNHCNVTHPSNQKLYHWVLVQRYKQDKLTDEQRSKLDSLGFDWHKTIRRRKINANPAAAAAAAAAVDSAQPARAARTKGSSRSSAQGSSDAGADRKKAPVENPESSDPSDWSYGLERTTAVFQQRQNYDSPVTLQRGCKRAYQHSQSSAEEAEEESLAEFNKDPPYEDSGSSEADDDDDDDANVDHDQPVRAARTERFNSSISQATTTTDSRKRAVVGKKPVSSPEQSNPSPKRRKTSQGDSPEELDMLRKLAAEQSKTIKNLKQDHDIKDDSIATMLKDLDDKDQTIATQRTELDSKDQTIEGQKNNLVHKDEAIASQKTELSHKNDIIASQTTELNNKEKTVAHLIKDLDDKDQTIATQKTELDSKDQTIEGQKNNLAHKDEVIASQKTELSHKNDIIAGQKKTITEQLEDIKSKDNVVAEQKQELKDKDETIMKQKQELKDKDEIIIKQRGDLHRRIQMAQSHLDELRRRGAQSWKDKVSGFFFPHRNN